MTAVERTESPRRAKPSKKAKGPAPVEEVVAPPANDPEAGDDVDENDDDPTEGEWLFRANDTVLGPVSAAVLVDKIKKDELPADTPIARDGQGFKPMRSFRLFREALAARADEKRYAAEERAWRSAMARTRVLRVFALLVLFAAPAAASVFGARKLVEARPWDDTPTWLARVPPLVDLPQKPPEVKTAPVVPPTETVATNTPSTDPAGGLTPGTTASAGTSVKKPLAGAGKVAAASSVGGSTDKGDSGGDNKVDSKVENKVDTPAETKPAGGALPETLTNSQAIEPLKGAQADLKACFKAEMESNPEIPAQVVLSYTVTEEGRAINIALDARELRGRPVVGCVQKAISALRWPRFTGERKNVSVPFKLGKPPAKK